MSAVIDLLKRPVRSVLRLPGVRHWLYRLHEYRLANASDDWPKADESGVPLPSAYLMQTVVGHSDWRKFLEHGGETAQVISDIVTRNGKPFEEAHRLLDLGCGCGRVIRFMPNLTKAELHGADYNGRLLAWCRANLPGHFRRNKLLPPLPYGSDEFDVIYLLSVFTHLRLASQRLWLAEFARVVSPGGIVVITFHDEDYVELIAEPVDREALARDGFTIRNDFSEGSNAMASFQTRALMEEICREHFDVCEIVGTHKSELQQAYAVLRRR